MKRGERKEGGVLTLVSVMLNPDILEAYDKLANKYPPTNRSQLIRDALSMGLPTLVKKLKQKGGLN